MRIHFDNVNFSSRSGPNSFGLKLARALSLRGHVIVASHELPDVQLSFIQSVVDVAPIIQRLDGVWFNTAQAWEAANAPILETYQKARAVIVQSEFDRRLVETFFGSRSGMHTVRNGTDVGWVQAQNPLSVPSLADVEKVWTCASSWRPHKRLAENVRYFREHAGPRDCLVVAGANPDPIIPDTRIFYAGDLDYGTLVSLYRATDYFLHLAWLDHSPNVVVDARAAGCHIICASSGGTEEVAGLGSTVIEEDPWDFKPCKLYEPPPLDFGRRRQGVHDVSIDINDVAGLYEKVIEGVFV